MEFNFQKNRKFNIVFLIDGLGMGGAERMMIPILQHLDRDIFSLRVCAFQEREGNPIANDVLALGIPVDFLPVPYLRDVTALPRLWNYLRISKADLVHTQLEFANTLGNFIAKLLRLPSVCTIHTLSSQVMNIKSRAHHLLEWSSQRWFCDRVIAVSEEARFHNMRVSGLMETKMITIYNGIDTSHFDGMENERDALRRELGIPLDAHLLTTVAVLREPKGIQFMLRAMSEILFSNPQTYYLIAGDGPYGSALREEAGKLQQSAHVIFAGMRKDIPRVLAASDIFVLPTLTEALPTVLAEAMSCRLPVVASAVGGVPEMVFNGENGLLVSPGDPRQLASACLTLLRDMDRSRKMGEQGWKIVHEKFDVLGQVDRLKQLYLELIKQYDR